MSWTDDSLYDRLPARDGSYDGRFVVGVLSTGIYCLPSCTARKPKCLICPMRNGCASYPFNPEHERAAP